MKPSILITACAALAGLLSAAEPSKPATPPTAGQQGWVSMFDGKTLNGWKASERPENWKVEDGAIVGRGDRSHLFWTQQQCENCEFFAIVKINKGGNSGMYFRAAMEPSWPKGYESQVNVSHKDPVKTGSLYNIVKLLETEAKDDEWYSEHIIADGNHIKIIVNGKTVVDHIEDKNMYTKGYLALQQHDPGSVVMFKNLMFRPLPPKK